MKRAFLSLALLALLSSCDLAVPTSASTTSPKSESLAPSSSTPLPSSSSGGEVSSKSISTYSESESEPIVSSIESSESQSSESEISSQSEAESSSEDSSEISKSVISSSINSSSLISSSLDESSVLTSLCSSSDGQISSQEVKELSPLDDPDIGRQYYLNHIGDIYGAWDSYRGKGITIAVVDIGFNPYHKDFKRADGTSKVREDSASFKVSGGSVVKSVGVDQVVNMGESHGTFCAGVAAAAINGVGVVGIAPDADLLLLKTDAKPKSIAAAFKYAADQGARAISVSIGSYYDYGGDLSSDGSDLGTVFDEPVAYCRSKGTVVISAAGNGGLDGQPTEFTFPGCVDGVIGVGGLAANSSGEIWKGSSYNSSPAYTFCDVYAPADMMYGCCHYNNKEYDGGWNGTSFAAPQVAGMAALYFEKNPEATVDQFEADLYASCHAITSSSIASVNQLGHGRVDVGALLGIQSVGALTITVSTSWTSCYCYAWNLATQTQNKNWPGIAMTKSGTKFTITLKANTFDSLIFTKGSSGPQTIDISVSSFREGHTYSLGGAVTENGCLVGKYIR